MINIQPTLPTGGSQPHGDLCIHPRGGRCRLVLAPRRGRAARLGHDTVAPDLPVEDDAAGLDRYADVVEAIGDRGAVVVVGQSLGGYVAPIVAHRVPAGLIVLVAGMVPMPGESAEEMFRHPGSPNLADTSIRAVFYHDVPDELAARRRPRAPPIGHSGWSRGRLRRGRTSRPASSWAVGIGSFRHVAAQGGAGSPGIVADEIDSGHCPALSRPHELASMLDRLRFDQGFVGRDE